MNNKHDHMATTAAAGSQAKSKKMLIIIVSILVVLVLAFCGIWFLFLKDYLAAQKSAPVYVTSVSAVTGSEIGGVTRYAAVVEPQKAVSVNKDDTKTISAISVTEGQEVKAGDPLFSYNIDEMNLTLEQSRLAVENSNNTIAEYKRQISDLEKERDNASSDNKLSYTIKIQTLQLNIKEQEYQASLKNTEIDKLAAAIQNNVVTAPVAGVIKSINEKPNPNQYGETPPFISILSAGDYRIKSSITEQQRYQISQGQAVIVRSRINPEVTWTGVVESIDFEKPNTDSGNGSMVVYSSGRSSGDSQSSSRYSFYVVLNDKNVIAESNNSMSIVDQNKLIIGQHIYVEPSSGMGTTKEGIWLPSYYLVQEDGAAYVWARNDKEKLEKRSIALGDYDADTDSYQITQGVETKDYLAMPDAALKNGLPTTTELTNNMFTGDLGNPDAGMAMPEGKMAADAEVS